MNIFQKEALLSALIMLILEYFVVMPRFTRDPQWFWPTLGIVAAMGYFSTLWVSQLQSKGLNLPKFPMIAILVALVEYPLAVYGPSVEPRINPFLRSILVGLMVAGANWLANFLIFLQQI